MLFSLLDTLSPMPFSLDIESVLIGCWLLRTERTLLGGECAWMPVLPRFVTTHPHYPGSVLLLFEHSQMAAAFRARLSLFWSFCPFHHAAQSMGVMRLFHIDQQRQKCFPVPGECIDCFFIWCFPRILSFLCSEGLPRRLSGAPLWLSKVLHLCSFLSTLSCEH